MSEDYITTCGSGRTWVTVSFRDLGGDVVGLIYNDNPHLGAVALAEYDAAHQRTSVSSITRLGHKDDIVARAAAQALSQALRRPACVIAGIHVDDITEEEIRILVDNCRTAVESIIARIGVRS